MRAGLLDRGLPEVAGDAGAERRADRGAPHAAPRHGALRASVGCRHRHLVAYFGQTLDKTDCGACDCCLEELEPLPDPVTLARKVLSCVARVGQRFGATHVTGVLRGATTDAVTTRRHHELSTFGLLSDASVPEVRGYIEQLSGQGFLRQTDDEFPVLMLTDRGVTLLKDASSAPDLALARLRRPVKGRAPSRARVETESWDGRRPGPVRAPAGAAPRDRARPRRAALRHLPRRDASRDGQAQAVHSRSAAPCLRRRRAQGCRARRRVPARDWWQLTLLLPSFQLPASSFQLPALGSS